MEGLPAGATFGSLVHAVLEEADPHAPDLAAELAARAREQPLSLQAWSLPRAHEHPRPKRIVLRGDPRCRGRDGGRLAAPHEQPGREDEQSTGQPGSAAHPERSRFVRRDDRHSEVPQPEGRARNAEGDQQTSTKLPPTPGKQDEDAERHQRDHDRVDRQPTLFGHDRLIVRFR